MSSGLRDSLIGPEPGAAIDGPLWVEPGQLAGCVEADSPVDLLLVCRAVSEYLFQLSARRYRQRLVTVRPKRTVEEHRGWWAGVADSYWTPTPNDWSMWAWSESDTYDLTLAAPVREIRRVMLDGVELEPGQVRLYDRRHLLLVDPDQRRLPWPYDQRLDLADDQPGTFSVTFVWGATIPYGGRIAALAWGCKLASQVHSLVAGGNCDLPDRVTQQTRQGTTLTRLQAIDFLKEGKVGVDLVDQWLHTINPSGHRRRATISSPDIRRGAVES